MSTGVAVGAATTGGGVAVAIFCGTLGTCVAAGVGVSTITTCVALGFGLAVGEDVARGDALAEALALGAIVVPGINVTDGSGGGVFAGLCEGVEDGEGTGDSADTNVAVASGSGVKLGAGEGAFTPPVPKNFVSKPPSANPHNTTRIINGTIGMPPRLGGSGSSRRRRG